MRCGVVCTTALAVACWAAPARACKVDLTGQPTTVSPTTDNVLPTNGRIVLDRGGGLLHGDFGDSLLQIEDSHPELRSDHERVALKVTETYDRRDGATVVLVAAHHLRPSTAYTLAFDQPPDNAPPARWTTASADDRSPPRWLARPTAEPGEYHRTDCGIDSHVSVTVPTADAPWIRVEWRPHGERRWRRSLNAPKDEQIKIWLPPDERYTLKLTAIDFAGNEVKAPGPPLEVIMPSSKLAKRP